MGKKILISLLLIIILGSFLRFYKPDWDGGYYLHPDERLYINNSNIHLPGSLDEFVSPKSPLNPHMFYYGEFPLFLYVSAQRLLHSFGFATNLLFLSRSISAFFSTATIPLVFGVSVYFMPPPFALLASFILAASTAAIQHAHFNTTETLLTFFAMLTLYLSFRLMYNKKKTLTAIFLGIISGLAFATKITGLTFLLMPGVSLFSVLFHNVKLHFKKNLSKFLLLLLFLVIPFVLTSFLGSPYNIIDYPSFKREQNYMQGVTYGVYKPPFVIIYEGTLPYFYYLLKILPFYINPFFLIAALFGWITLVLQSIINKKFDKILLVIFPSLYFLWVGFWYAKFARYMVPLLPFLAIFAAYTFYIIYGRLRLNKRIFYILILLVIAVQNYYTLSSFYNIYILPNTRIDASLWIFTHIPIGSKIATEHWDDALPLYIQNQPNPSQIYTHMELKVYDAENADKITALTVTVSQSDYIIFSSRRVFYSILRNPDKYPFTSRFYQDLFTDKIGFKLVKDFSRKPDVFGLSINDDYADETIQSYDHPHVYIFKNERHLSAKDIIRKITQDE